MTSTALPSKAFMYIVSDVLEEQTLVEWRRDRDAARPRRSARRTFRLPRLRPGW